MALDKSIFKAYDIRGTYPDQIDEHLSYQIGRAISCVLHSNPFVVGRDMRECSQKVHDFLIKGLLESGSDVTDIGMVSTDTLYHACSLYHSSGVMVTASHNPPQYGGFKIVKKLPHMLSKEDGLSEVCRLVECEKYTFASKKGRLFQSDVNQKFVDYVLSKTNSNNFRPMKIVADTGNGMAGPILKETYDQIPQIEMIYMNLEPNGVNPSHGWDPLQLENRQDLELKVLNEKADLGFAFDGDGDRFFIIDNSGEFVSGDFLTALLAQHMLLKYPKSKIIYDVRSSRVVPDQILAFGGVPLEEKVGHSFIKRRMVKENAVFGGEVTGHYYFSDFHFVDSGIFPSLILLEMLSKTKLSLSDILSEFRNKYFISGEINIPINQTSEVNAAIKKIEEKFRNTSKIEKTDGVSVISDLWRFNVRPSNTEPFVRLNLEAESADLLRDQKELILEILRQ